MLKMDAMLQYKLGVRVHFEEAAGVGHHGSWNITHTILRFMPVSPGHVTGTQNVPNSSYSH